MLTEETAKNSNMFCWNVCHDVMTFKIENLTYCGLLEACSWCDKDLNNGQLEILCSVKRLCCWMKTHRMVILMHCGLFKAYIDGTKTERIVNMISLHAVWI